MKGLRFIIFLLKLSVQCHLFEWIIPWTEYFKIFLKLNSSIFRWINRANLPCRYKSSQSLFSLTRPLIANIKCLSYQIKEIPCKDSNLHNKFNKVKKYYRFVHLQQNGYKIKYFRPKIYPQN